MKFLVIIYTDDKLIDALPEGRFDEMMRDCITHTDELRRDGHFLDAHQLEAPTTAKTLRMRSSDRMAITDGPFAETKEILAGFNVIEAADMDEAVRIASELPWSRLGAIEVRPVRDLAAVRQRVGA